MSLPDLPKDKLDKLNRKVKDKGFIDREHLMEFLTLIPSNNADHIIEHTKNWLQNLHDDPEYDKIVFPKGDIDAVLGDLDSYGRVATDTILKFREHSNKVPPMS